jgi:hypothetical protein
MSIQQNIASDYYAMANRAQTPEQINAVRQHIAQTIQNGGLEAYKGIPILNDLNGKLQALQSADQMKAGLLPQKPPIAQQVLAQAAQPQQVPQGIAQLQQPIQPEPMPTEDRSSGVDELPSRLPTEMAEGGIVPRFSGPFGSQVSSSLLQPGFGELFNGPVNEMNRNPNKPYTMEEIQKNLREGRAAEAARNAHKIGPPAPPAAPSSFWESMRKFGGSSDANVFPNMPNTGGIADLNYFNLLQAELKKDPSNQTFKNEINKLVSKNPKLESQSLQLTPSKLGSNPYDVEDAQLGISQKGPTELPQNVQETLDKYKTSKKEEVKEIKKLNDAPLYKVKKEVADNIVKQEVGPPKDLMSAETTTPKEDALSKYEQMLTQAPEARQKERDLDFYTRLFQAGIGIASGGSRNALENLKEAQPAIAGFASDIAKQREEDRSRIKDLAALGLKREEFGMELKKLGLTEKQINALTQHYADWNRHNIAMEGLEGQKNAIHAASVANSRAQGNDMKILAQVDSVFKNLLSDYNEGRKTNPLLPPPNYENLYSQAQSLISNTTGKTIGTPINTPNKQRTTWADFNKG